MKKLIGLLILLVASKVQAQTMESLAVKAADGTAIKVVAAGYSVGHSVAGEVRFPAPFCPNNSFKVTEARIFDRNGDLNTAEYSVIFNGNRFLGTTTANNAFDPTDAELPTLQGPLTIASTDRYAFADNGMSSLNSLKNQLKVIIPSTGDRVRWIYAVIVITSGTPTYATADDIAVKITMECDNG